MLVKLRVVAPNVKVGTINSDAIVTCWLEAIDITSSPSAFCILDTFKFPDTVVSPVEDKDTADIFPELDISETANVSPVLTVPLSILTLVISTLLKSIFPAA